MDKRIDKLINPPWLEVVRRSERRIADLKSVAMSTEKKFIESTKLASLTFNEPEIMKSMQRGLAEANKLTSLAFQQLEAQKSIKQFAEISELTKLALEKVEAMKSYDAIAESSRISALVCQQSETLKQLQSIDISSRVASITLMQSEALKKISQFNNLASFKGLASLANSPFPESSSLAFISEMTYSEQTDDALIQIDAQITDEISSVTDFNALSEETKSILLYLYHYYFLPLFIGLLAAYMVENSKEARKELVSVSTPSEARAFVRSSSNKFDRAALKSFRVTTVGTLNFRDSPSMQSKIITTLPVGTLVEVMDKSHRSWLLVEVEINGELEQGWVSRRYTAYFK